MGKEGPCYHCGITSTPLWRNGPPDKPVLCNACGSRWRTKGTLVNYTPLHARTENFDSLHCKASIGKLTPSKTKDQKLSKRKWLDDEEEFREPRSNRCHTLKVIDEDSSNKSSSGSAVSYSESCAQFIEGDSSDIVGSAQSNIWEPLIPSRKRTCIKHSNASSSIKKLTKDLYGILCEQQSSDLSPSFEEELLFEAESPMISFEFGTGGVLIKHLNLSQGKEEESEASSISVDSCKPNIINGAHPSLAISPNIRSKKVDFSRIPVESNYTRCSPKDHVKREIFPHDKFHVLRSRNSPLSCIDLKDIICFEEFGKHLTCLEQKQLMKYLPSVDTANDHSLLVMFKSTQLERAMYNFQQLLLEGVFDLSFLGTNIDDCRVLKRLVLLNLKSSKWIEHYRFLKDTKNRVMGEKNVVEKPVLVSDNLKSNMRSCNGQHVNLSESTCVKQNPKGLNKGSKRDFSSLKPLKTNNTESSMDSGQFTADQDLLLDVPSYESVLHAELIDSHPLKSANISNIMQ